MPQIRVVVPCYNEAKRFPAEVVRQFLIAQPGVSLVLVDDGSKDETLSVLQDFARSAPEQVTVLSLEKNSGKAEAVRHGMLWALEQEGSDFVGYWDADLATPFCELPRFLDTFDQFPHLQLVMGARVRLLGRQIQRKPLRHYLGRLFATLASLVLRLPVYDTQCGAKVFRANDLTKSLFSRTFMSRWIFDVEIIARMQTEMKAKRAEHSIYELSLNQWNDVHGSKVKPFDFVKAFVELTRIYWNYRRAPVRRLRKAKVAGEAQALLPAPHPARRP